MNKTELANKTCQLYPAGTMAFDEQAINSYLPFLEAGWTILSGPSRLQRTFKTRHFQQTFHMASKVYQLSEEQNHHPRLTLSYSQFEVEIWTHSVKGLQESDFIFAAKLDRIFHDENF